VPMMSLRGGSNIEILQLGYAGIAVTTLLALGALAWPPRPATCEPPASTEPAAEG